MLLPVDPPGYVHVDPTGGLDPDRRRLGGVVTKARSRRLHVGGQADAEIPPGGPGLGLLPAERLVAEHLEGLLERLQRCDAIEGLPFGLV